jgi:hypothetical protein
LPAAAAAQNIQLRWRCGTDISVGSTGWRIDTIAISDTACCSGSSPTPILGVSPAGYNFGTLLTGQISNTTFAVVNTGSGTLTGSAAAASPFAVVSGGSYSLGAAQTDVVTVSFSSASAGTFTGKLIVASNGGNATNALTGADITAQQSWANHYGVAVDGLDPTGDGWSNTNKFLAGFNPTNSAAYAHVISAVQSGNDMNITYLGANGDTSYAGGPSSRTNVLEFTAGTGGGNYTNGFASTGQTNILSGGTGLGVVTNMVDRGGATNTPSRYYRVRVLAP